MATCQILTSLIDEVKSAKSGDETVINVDHSKILLVNKKGVNDPNEDIAGSRRDNTEALTCVHKAHQLSDPLLKCQDMEHEGSLVSVSDQLVSTFHELDACTHDLCEIHESMNMVARCRSLPDDLSQGSSSDASGCDIDGLDELVLIPEDDGDLDHDSEFQKQRQVPLFDRGQESTAECPICLDTTTLYQRQCCRFPACDSCVDTYIKTNVEMARIIIPCLNTKCMAPMFSNEILARLPDELTDKYYQFLIDANKNPGEKTCPRCSLVKKVTPKYLSQHKSKKGLLVKCTKCELDWCFLCHAPWHRGMKCQTFRKGNRPLKHWSKEFREGQVNAQRCPKCKVYIQRDTGCDSMTCSQCNTEFCYQCGGRFLEIFLVGAHDNPISVLGCNNTFLPGSPHKRRFVRGALYAGSIALGVALAPVLAVAAVPFGIHKVRKVLRRRRKRIQERDSRMLLEQWWLSSQDREPDMAQFQTLGVNGETRQEMMDRLMDVIRDIQLLNPNESVIREMLEDSGDGIAADVGVYEWAPANTGDNQSDQGAPSVIDGTNAHLMQMNESAISDCSYLATDRSSRDLPKSELPVVRRNCDEAVSVVDEKLSGEWVFISRKPVVGPSGDWSSSKDIVTTTDVETIAGESCPNDATLVINVKSHYVALNDIARLNTND